VRLAPPTPGRATVVPRRARPSVGRCPQATSRPDRRAGSQARAARSSVGGKRASNTRLELAAARGQGRIPFGRTKLGAGSSSANPLGTGQVLDHIRHDHRAGPPAPSSGFGSAC